MATDVNLPELGESVTEGTVTQWLKQVGDDVALDEPLLEISTDKVDTEIPSPVAGKLLEIKAAQDETVEVGAVLAVIGSDSDASDEGPSASDESLSPSDESPSASDDSSDQEPPDQHQGAGEAEQGRPPGDESGDEQASADRSLVEEPPAEEHETAESQAEESPANEPPAAEPQAEESPANEPPAAEPQAEEPRANEPPAAEPQAEEPRANEPPAEEPQADESAAHETQQADSSGRGEGTDVTLPALGESVTEGTVTQWLKQVGDEVAVDEPLLEVSTDKVDTEIPSPVAGTLLEIRAGQDETVEVGAVLAVVGAGAAKARRQPESEPESQPDAESQPETEQRGARQPETEPPRAREPDTEAEPETEQQHAAESKPKLESDPTPDRGEAAAAESAPTEPAAAESAPTEAAGRTGSDREPTYVTPLVRKLAAQHDVDLAELNGSGVGGRIRKQDVLAAADARKQAVATAPSQPATPATEPDSAAGAEPSPLRGKTEKLSRLRQLIARRMVESLQTSAQLTTVVEVDVTAISRLRTRHKDSFAAREGVKLSYLPFFAKAAVDALKVYPQLNASIDTEKNEVTYSDAENLGVAVDTERGLLVATVRDAGDLSIAGLARKIADLAERTRTNKITPDELSGATFTLTNTGSRGALFDTPIIFQPQVAILGTGAVVKRPVVIDDPNLGETIAVRQMVYLALTYDHRLVDGADAARFLTAVKQRLEDANFEADLGA